MKNKGKATASRIFHEHKEGKDGLRYKTLCFGDTIETVCRDDHGRLRTINRKQILQGHPGSSCDESQFALAAQANNASPVEPQRVLKAYLVAGGAK